MSSRVQESKDELAKVLYDSTFILLLPTLALSLFRAYYIGWQSFHSIQAVLAVVFIFAFLWRKRMSTTLRVHLLAIVLCLVGISATSYLGLVSGYFIGIGGVVLSALFFHRLIVLLYGSIFVLSFSGIGLAIAFGLITISIDLNAYQLVTISRIARGFSVIWLLWLLCYIVYKLQLLYFENLIELEGKNSELEEKNRKLLTHEIELKQQNEEYLSLNEELKQSNEKIRMTNRALDKSRRQAQESDKLKTAFLHNISHEIRTPLNGMLGFYQLLTYTTDTEKIAYYDKVIQRSSQQLITIVDDVLEMSQLEAGEIEISKSCYALKRLLEEVYVVFEELAKEKKLSFSISGGLETDLNVVVDALKVKQVLKSLLSNAFKFTNVGTVELGCLVEKKQIVFWVKDTGIGISPDAQEKIFDYFHQAEEHVVGKYGGTGLGLSISKGLVNLMNGKIWLMSESNEGSTFGFSLPFERC